MKLVNDARARITEESQKIGGPLAQFIEETVNEVLIDEEAAKAVEGKSMEELIKSITAKAKETARNNVGMFTSEEVKEMTLEFYGLNGSAKRDTGIVDVLDLM